MRLLFLVTLLLVVGLTRPAAAYPITPVHLWELVEESDVVVLATVETVGLSATTDTLDLRDAPSSTVVRTAESGPSVARLHVLETWKGSAPARVEVPFNSGMICPSPPRFVAGETVAAFLRQADTAWHVVALSYGVRTLPPQAIVPMRDRIREAQALQAGGAVGRRQRVEWLVACCEHPATRWDSFRELAPNVHWFDEAYDRSDRVRDFAAALSKDQVQRIVAAVLTDPPDIHEVPLVAHILRRQISAELTTVLVAAVEEAFGDDQNRYVLREAMIAVASRLDVPDARTRFDALAFDFEREDYYPPIADFRREWAAAMKSMATDHR